MGNAGTPGTAVELQAFACLTNVVVYLYDPSIASTSKNTPAGAIIPFEIFPPVSPNTTCLQKEVLLWGDHFLAVLDSTHPLTQNKLYDMDRERERELRKEGREVPSRVRLREGPIGVRITLGQPTIG